MPTDRSTGFPCGNNPSHPLSPGDRVIVDEFAAFLSVRSTDGTPPLWEQLVQWQPAIAAALALYARALPADWSQRVFEVGRPDAALALPPGAQGEQFPDRAPEIAPYDDVADNDSCPACAERGEFCRWHAGFAAGHHDRVQAQLDAAKVRPDMPLREFMLWEADVAEALDHGETPPALPSAPPAFIDRAAVLREAADALDNSKTLRDLTDDHMHDVNAAANELRRMADEKA